MKRIINFNPGPAVLPLEVLETAQAELLNFRGTNISILEVSHRSKEYEEMHNAAIADFKSIAGVNDDYTVLFLQGGASLQFLMLAQNMLYNGATADYINTGAWSKAAIKEAKRFAALGITTTENADGTFTRIPRQAELKLNKDAKYVHYTTNNTIFGTQFDYVPETGAVPLVADMSSDIFSRSLPFNKFALIYAGAQKNIGPAGVTAVLARKDFLAKANPDLPTMLAYKTHLDNNSLFNTCPCFSIYILGLTLQWIKKQGLAKIEEINDAKAKLVYDAIDGSKDYFKSPVEKASRSKMNIVFRLADEGLEEKFVKEAKAAGIIGVKGHRSVGGIRFSIYNASSLTDVQTAVQFMQDFKAKN